MPNMAATLFLIGHTARRLGHALVFCKIRAALGIMRTIISGGGSLAPHLDDFFEVMTLPAVAINSDGQHI